VSPRAWRGPSPAWAEGSTRILFDCRYTRLDRHDGISRYGERLVAQIGARHPVVMLISDERQLRMLPELPWTLGPSPTSALEPLIAARAINRLEPDVVFTPMQTMGAFGRRYPLVSTVHDLIYYSHPAPPRDLPAAIRAIWRIYHLTYAFQRFVLNRASAHTTISETTRDLMVANRMTRHPIRVIHNGVDHPAVPPERAAPPRVDGRFDVLYMGSFMPYKNVETLASAMRELPGWRLRILSRAPEAEQARLLAAAGGAADAIEFLGGVSDEEYADALARARVLASASRDEGFGLPVVEAMAAGTPVAISDIPIFREVAGADAEYFDPDSSADAALAIRAYEDDAHWVERSHGAVRRAAAFDWSAAGEQLLDFLLETARAHPVRPVA
jgi:glycosyltransferase involved in cell wall biosynthesis